MRNFEYCELWWSNGNHPNLTFYTPAGGATVSIEKSTAASDSWESLEEAITELALGGWQLVSASHGSGGLFFKRHLQ